LQQQHARAPSMSTHVRAWVCSGRFRHTAGEELLAHSQGIVRKRIEFACRAQAGDPRVGAPNGKVQQRRYARRSNAQAAMQKWTTTS